MSEPYDTIFSLPSTDDDPDTEIGVLLMGLGPERLLAGLGVAHQGRARDPATVTLVVDQLRHDARPGHHLATALAVGAARWRTAHDAAAPALRPVGPPSAALRQLWTSTAAALAVASEAVPALRTTGPAEHVYLVACWLRREEINRLAEEHRVLPELPA